MSSKINSSKGRNTKKKISITRGELENIYMMHFPYTDKKTLKKKNMNTLSREIDESILQTNGSIKRSSKKSQKQNNIIKKSTTKSQERNEEFINTTYNNIDKRYQFINDIIEGKIKITDVRITYPYTITENKALGKRVINNVPCNILSAIEILKGNVKYLSSEKGVTGYPFNICINKEEDCKNIYNQFGIKILPYVIDEDYIDYLCVEEEKEEDDEEEEAILYCSMIDANRPENVESHMLYTLSTFVLNKQTPHIMLPIMSFLCNVTDLIKNYDNPQLDLQDRLDTDDDETKIYDKAVVLITEWANGGDLQRYIRKNMDKWYRINQSELIFSVIFFQLIFTLLVIYERYPQFRHNDLKVDNVLVTEIPSGGFYLYHIDNKYYKIPNVGVQIKLWDFDLSCIKDVIDNYKIIDMSEFGIRDTKNQYYDIHCFLNFLRINTIGENNYNKIPESIQNFWERYIPLKYRGEDEEEDIDYEGGGREEDEEKEEKEENEEEDEEILVYWGRVIPDDEWTTPLKILRKETNNYLFKPFLINREDIDGMEFIDRFNL